MGIDTHVTNQHLQSFADDRVNLPSEFAKEYREQVNTLRDKLTKYINEHPDFTLVKMLHAGSVAKGTALRDIGDMDVAVYVTEAAAPNDGKDLNQWLADRLREAYGDWKKKEDFVPQTHCVTVQFHGSGLDVDVVPVLYEGGKDDRGFLVTKDTGERLLTSIPLHLAFTRSNKEKHDPHYRQLIRFVKWWKNLQAGDFRFKSFMIELIVAHLYRNQSFAGLGYIEALSQFFSYIIKSKLQERIIFNDYYASSQVKPCNDPIQIFDPVNPDNNVARTYSNSDREAIVSAASESLDAIGYGRRATTKEEALQAWREVLGASFKV